ncbi:S41 family peptidase [Roseiflexus castenholzii]|uniref:Peptidase S41 n=1 Tax=Roseiflexus castenholzii (strain DSM 13941 / HLO8) TaxID=383372 RepID=A7NQZ4_ROSCS|nr:S41 family peptidase [Roseiflexus castenholzii]ABU59990.1 peptidase S41 [Roseiflexus castenholzii DSM 13941]
MVLGNVLLRLGAVVSIVTLTGCGMAPVSTVRSTTAATDALPAWTEGIATSGASTPATATVTPLPSPTLVPTPIPTLTPTPDVPALDERLQIFDEVWRIVNEEYLYDDFGGIDWEGLYPDYRARIMRAQSRDEFYAAMIDMVAQLNDNHSRFVPPASVEAEDATASGQETRVGIGVSVQPKPDGGFIQQVFPESPAARAGIRPRDRIVAVDGRPYAVSDGDLQGDIGTSVRLTIARPGAKLRDVLLTRQEVRASILPYYRRFPGDIGYVAVPTLWVHDMGEQVSGALTDLVAGGSLRGLILDLRSNRGGWGEVLSGVLSHFVRGQVGVFFGRDYVRPLVVNPPAGPDMRNLSAGLVVLIDEETASYAEVLAAVLQAEAGAIVVGARSAGNTETIYAHALRDGSRLWLAQEGFRLRNGTDLEGRGVIPDVLLEVDWTRYSEDDDPQLLEALRLLGGGPK